MVDKILYVEGRAVPKLEAGQDTDRIMPARFMKTVTFRDLGNNVFYDERFNADGSQKPHPFNETRYQRAGILLAGADFGCGSSREHAPQGLKRWGIQGIVAESYHAIFRGNCTNIGLVTVTASPEDISRLAGIVEVDPSSRVGIDLSGKNIYYYSNYHGGGTGNFPCDIPEEMRQAFLDGSWDSLGVLLANQEKVELLAKQFLHRFS